MKENWRKKYFGIGGRGVIEVIGVRGAGCGVREGVPLSRHEFFMGNLHRQPGQL